MAEIVNLRRARKQKAREAAEETAAQNRAKFGRTKAERAAQTLEAVRLAKLVEGHRRDE